jgi:hypothetical protein
MAGIVEGLSVRVVEERLSDGHTFHKDGGTFVSAGCQDHHQ